MSGNEIIKHASIKSENLDPNQYTLSLMKEGLRTGLMDRQSIYGVQEQVMQILKGLIAAYTKGESSSVKTETAEGLLNSIYYSVDACVSGFDDPEAGIALLKMGNVKGIYNEGLEIVDSAFKEARLHCRGLVKNKLDVPLEVYNTSVTESLPEFFQNYSIIFGAHDTTCSLDYPLIFDDMNVRGVFYISNYMANLQTETDFCRLFSKADIDKLLTVYGRTCRVDYKEAPVNLFEIVANNSIFSAVSGNSAAELKITRQQYEIIRERLKGRDYGQMGNIIETAVDKLITDLGIGQPGLKDYICRYSRDFVLRVLNAAENDNLCNIAMVYAEGKLPGRRNAFVEADRLNDARFRYLVQRIKSCNTAQEKVSMIMSEVSSVEDYIDILDAGCLFGDEYQTLFAALGDIELAVLAKTLPTDELRSSRPDLSVLEIEENETAGEWQSEYLRFVRGLDGKRKKKVEELIDTLDML
ncbi:MAG TPA: DUF6179 domain-containing protein [Candidatus Nitrosocosmicus sp.]|nr:DUF6179 domain-containing protein [Candidatus Nitrosocosmicus sp.]